jgi:hypothetical protein
MGPCIVSISNKMQRHTVYLYLEIALHVSGGTSTHHQEFYRGTCIQGRRHLVIAATSVQSCAYRSL